jgi:hypothetical protein
VPIGVLHRCILPNSMIVHAMHGCLYAQQLFTAGLVLGARCNYKRHMYRLNGLCATHVEAKACKSAGHH